MSVSVGVLQQAYSVALACCSRRRCTGAHTWLASWGQQEQVHSTSMEDKHQGPRLGLSCQPSLSCSAFTCVNISNN